MAGHEPGDVFVTGLGVTTAIGQGVREFTAGLLEGRSNFSVMRRPGRQCALAGGVAAGVGGLDGRVSTAFIGAEIGELALTASIQKSPALRTASLSGRVALLTLQEAWSDARLEGIDPARIGLVVGGSNFQQRELVVSQESFRSRPQFLRPSYGMSFMDSDVCGLCTEHFGIRGFAYTIGGASASGQLAAIHGVQAVLSGQVDVCVVVGALMDLSYWECQGLRAIGAMGSDRYSNDPARACRPFDRDRDGFIYGECCGVLIIEGSARVKRDGVRPYARLAGWSVRMDANRNPNPSLEGEVGAIRGALEHAGWSAGRIDYINPHGTGSMVGDETELRAIRECGLSRAHLNATKSLTGHGLTAAGAVEIIATLVQMSQKKLHPTLNLQHAMEPGYEWVGVEGADHVIRNALSLSFGFGGVNTAVCLERV